MTVYQEVTKAFSDNRKRLDAFMEEASKVVADLMDYTKSEIGWPTPFNRLRMEAPEGRTSGGDPRGYVDKDGYHASFSVAAAAECVMVPNWSVQFSLTVRRAHDGDYYVRSGDKSFKICQSNHETMAPFVAYVTRALREMTRNLNFCEITDPLAPKAPESATAAS